MIQRASRGGEYDSAGAMLLVFQTQSPAPALPRKEIRDDNFQSAKSHCVCNGRQRRHWAGHSKGLASAGAAVVIAGRNEAKGQSALSELRAITAAAEFVEFDVAQEQSCQRAIQHTVERFGRLDIVVNNAGTTVRKQPQDLTLDDWRSVMDTNLTGAFLCAKLAYTHMVRSGGRQDHQHRLDDVDLRRLLCRALRGEQGRHRADHAAPWQPRGPRTTFRSTPFCPAGSTPT